MCSTLIFKRLNGDLFPIPQKTHKGKKSRLVGECFPKGKG